MLSSYTKCKPNSRLCTFASKSSYRQGLIIFQKTQQVETNYKQNRASNGIKILIWKQLQTFQRIKYWTKHRRSKINTENKSEVSNKQREHNITRIKNKHFKAAGSTVGKKKSYLETSVLETPKKEIKRNIASRRTRSRAVTH